MRRSACFLCRLISRDRLGNFIADEPLAFTVLQAWFSGIDRCHCHRHGGSSCRISPGSRCLPSQEGTGSMRRSACFLCRLISRDRLGNFIADEPLAFTVLQAWFSGIDRCHCHRHGGSSCRVSPGSRCLPGGYRAPNPTGNRLLLLLAFQRPQGDDSSGHRTCCRLGG